MKIKIRSDRIGWEKRLIFSCSGHVVRCAVDYFKKKLLEEYEKCDESEFPDQYKEHLENNIDFFIEDVQEKIQELVVYSINDYYKYSHCNEKKPANTFILEFKVLKESLPMIVTEMKKFIYFNPRKKNIYCSLLEKKYNVLFLMERFFLERQHLLKIHDGLRDCWHEEARYDFDICDFSHSLLEINSIGLISQEETEILITKLADTYYKSDLYNVINSYKEAIDLVDHWIIRIKAMILEG